MSDAPAGATEVELRELELRLIAAIQARDLAFLERVLAPDFTLTTGRAGAEVRTRQEWLQISAQDYVIEEFHFEEMTVQDYGTAAVVRSRYTQRGSMKGDRRDTTFRMTDVWVRHEQRGWLLHVRHAQPVSGD